MVDRDSQPRALGWPRRSVAESARGVTETRPTEEAAERKRPRGRVEVSHEQGLAVSEFASCVGEGGELTISRPAADD